MANNQVGQVKDQVGQGNQGQELDNIPYLVTMVTMGLCHHHAFWGFWVTNTSW